MKKVEFLISDLIEKARTLQAESNGPDRDYYIAAERDLKEAENNLLVYIKKIRKGKN